MQTNVPVDMIFVCNTLGEVKPMRFRLENELHERVTVDINEILYRKEAKPSGVRILIFVCRVFLYEEEHLIELHYNIESLKWTLYRMVS
ncbi:hypothetical protein [Clostridium sp. Marseille-P299]|uniref:hypothetical protein n=1 Tax=Clostridium sp. Marseille-P299 TaxID=1805477 RepID=UPI00082A7F4A|nr:hypothetical protein [Clostridium sp. Marseille-P299]